MSKLKEEFVKAVMEIENEDASQYKTMRLKRRLQEGFHSLFFHKPERRYNSEIVFSEDVNQGSVVERALTTDDRSDEDKEHEDDQDEENEGMVQQPSNQQRMALKDLYLVALNCGRT